MHPLSFIFIGRSGCGKGTQVKLLSEHLGREQSQFPIRYLESGARFRKFIERGSYTSALSRKVYEAGGLQPAFLSIWVWSDLMVEELRENEHLVLDGLPRKPEEAIILDGAFEFYGRARPVVVFLDITRELAIARLKKRGRSDDSSDEKIAKKLDWYETDVVPTIEFFRNNPKYQFLHIDGSKDPNDIHREIVSAV